MACASRAAEMTDPLSSSPPKHSGGKFRKGVSGNPGGKKKAFVPSRVVRGPAPDPQAPQDGPQDASAEGTHAGVEGLEKTTSKQRSYGFQPGQSGNPAGRPKGARNHATRLAEAMLDGQAHELTQRAIELAMAGDASVMRALLDRLIAPRRDRPVSLKMPEIKSAADLILAAAALTEAASEGAITPVEAASLSTLVANTAKAVETFELAARLAKLEERMAAKGSTL
jgi:Family of unknown function (DUF5681)